MYGAPALARLLPDSRGATAVEFAMVAPALLLVLLGLMDLSYNIYATTLLEGAIQRAARDSTIEGAEGRGAEIDSKVRATVDDLVSNAAIEFERRAYADFSDVSEPEDFSDTDGDGICAEGEPFEDINGNGTWDADRGSDGMGGARDAVLYTVTVSYPRAFPLMKAFGFDANVTVRSSTVLRNQPYGEQDRTVVVGSCT
jgi:Flp pilus assembly pilin Flp